MSALPALVGMLLLVPATVSQAPPMDHCLRAIYPNYAPAWCGQKNNNAYGAFVSAYNTYRAEIEKEYLSNLEVLSALSLACSTDSPPTAMSITMLLSPLTMVSRPANDAATKALNSMKANAPAAFNGNPDAVSIGSALEGFRDVIDRFGRNTMLIESAGEIEPTACTAAETVPQASEALGAQVKAAIEANNAYEMGTILIDQILADTDTKCASVRVVPPIPPGQMKSKTGFPTKTVENGGASLTFPKKLKVGKAAKLPLTVTNPGTGYGSVTVTKGPKGIVASGGQMNGSFGLWLTIPAKTSSGKAIVDVVTPAGRLQTTVRFQ